MKKLYIYIFVCLYNVYHYDTHMIHYNKFKYRNIYKRTFIPASAKYMFSTYRYWSNEKIIFERLWIYSWIYIWLNLINILQMRVVCVIQKCIQYFFLFGTIYWILESNIEILKKDLHTYLSKYLYSCNGAG